MKSPFRAAVALLALFAAAPAPGDPFVDQLGAAIRSGHVDLTFALVPGKVPLTSGWSIETTGAPRARLQADADEGRLRHLTFGVEGGQLVVAGKGLRPDVVVEALEADGDHGVTSARFHGRGFFGKIVIGLFRGVGMSAVRKMKFHTDLPSLFRGDILVHEAEAAPAPAAKPAARPAAPAPTTAPPPPSAPSGAPPAPPGPSLFDLVGSIEVDRSTLTAWPGKPLEEPMFRLRTADTGEPVHLSIASARWRPSRGDTASSLDLDGELDGAFSAGEISYSGERLAFSSGALRRARVLIRSAPSGPASTSMSAAALDLRLTSGRFAIPGGIRVAIDGPSRFTAADLAISDAGKVSGTLDLDLHGKTGEWKQNGMVIQLSDVAVLSRGLRVADNVATGSVGLDFDYRVLYPFTITYPVKEIGARHVDLTFAGPLHADLALDRAGDAEHGKVGGTYVLKLPWQPVERAAFEAMRARWSEDLAAIRKVDFTLDPAEFGPCGESCFVAKFNVVAEKKSGKRSIFRAECAPEGKANLVIDKDAGVMRLENMKIETHCKGLASIVNFIAPLFAKAYGDVTLFQMPADMPLTIDSVRSGMAWIELAGRLRWAAAPPAPPPAASPSGS